LVIAVTVHLPVFTGLHELQYNLAILPIGNNESIVWKIQTDLACS
jgi:hypothetical protein